MYNGNIEIEFGKLRKIMSQKEANIPDDTLLMAASISHLSQQIKESCGSVANQVSGLNDMLIEAIGNISVAIRESNP